MPVAGSWIPQGNDQARLTAQLRNFEQMVANAAALGKQIAAVMTQMNVSGTNYTDIETYFSITPSATPGANGHVANDVVGGAAAELAAGNLLVLTQRFG